MNARWPTSGDVDKLMLMEVNYLDDLLREFRMRIKKMMDLREKVIKWYNISHYSVSPPPPPPPPCMLIH